MYRIAKQFNFCASHQLGWLEQGHKCSRLHGHGYTVELILQSDTLNAAGMVVDFGELKEFGHYLDQRWDHQHLNGIMEANPTAENIAAILYDWAKQRWPQVVAVRIWETANAWAQYSEGQEAGRG